MSSTTDHPGSFAVVETESSVGHRAGHSIASEIKIPIEKDDFTSGLAPVAGVDLRWEGIVVRVPNKGKTDKIATNKKTILHGVSGSLLKSEMACVLGPSGAGKTTLMHALSGRLGHPFEGRVMANGEDINPVQFRKNIAFVLQEESLFSTQTPREALQFSAAMRLHGDVDEKERHALVEALIVELGLEKCADSLIGGELIRGISGGEKRRVSIGIELITNPKILFLDEPTSGLDSTSATQLIQTLRKLCIRGCSVICTIHQPSSEIFHSFNKCFLLAAGQMLYAASTKKMPKHFESLQMGCPPTYNMADHVMNLVQRKGEEGQKNIAVIREAWEKKEVKEHAGDMKTPKLFISGTAADEPPIKAGVLLQISYLLSREIRGVYRDSQSMKFRVFFTAFMNILFGVVFEGVGTGEFPESRYGALVMVSMFSMFGTAQPQMMVFVLERKAFLREYLLGAYSVVSYFFAKFLIEIVVTLAQTLLGLVCCYFIMDLQSDFFQLWMALFLLGMVAQSQTTLIGCTTTTVKEAMEILPGAFVPQLLFAGFFIRISQV
mmetsp:Transcript_39777/g.77307  ORF Transcript_39777/g.77307 Transcript_39777/m.77307 type:complete len:550 (-) Transcript_39777:511-2160(-)